jgi:dienelactone hydrolase
MRYVFSLLVVICVFSYKVIAQRVSLYGGDTVSAEADAAYNTLKPDSIYYTSNTLRLKGYIYKPSGKGPFPVCIWNHGSEKYPDYDEKLAAFWVKQGYIFFKPIRSGHSDNPGYYICDREKQIRKTKEMEQVQFKQIYALHEKANEDVIAALQWIKKQPYADSNNIVMAGASYGGIQVLLTAEKATGIKCFIAMAPASTIWYKAWGDSLTEAINRTKRPIFLLQAKNDYSLGPAETLGPILEKKGYPNQYRIFPNRIVHGGNIADHKQGHGEFFADPKAWEKEVLKYLKDCGVRKE